MGTSEQSQLFIGDVGRRLDGLYAELQTEIREARLWSVTRDRLPDMAGTGIAVSPQPGVERRATIRRLLDPGGYVRESGGDNDMEVPPQKAHAENKPALLEVRNRKKGASKCR